MGTLRVDELNFNKVLTLHVYEELPHPIKAEDMGKLYKFLKDDDEYVKEHSPVWT